MVLQFELAVTFDEDDLKRFSKEMIGAMNAPNVRPFITEILLKMAEQGKVTVKGKKTNQEPEPEEKFRP